MPFIDIRLSTPPNQQQAQQLCTGVTSAMGHIAGKREEVTAVSVQGLAGTTWTIAAQPPEAITAFVEVKITAGSNSREEKAALIAHLHTLLSDTLGELAEASYIVLHELPAENWGYGGQTQAARREAQQTL